MSLHLKQILVDIKQPQSKLAQHCEVSPAAISQLINHNIWPKNNLIKHALRTDIRVFLTSHGVKKDAKNDAFLEVAPQRANAAAPDLPSKKSKPTHHNNEVDDMLLRKQTLTPEAKRQFNLVRDPFGPIECAEDMWLSPGIRYVNESMMQTAKHSGFLAVIGESGAGKTSIVEALESRIHEDNLPILLIKPYVLAAEDNDIKGKTLKSTHIAEAVLREVAPLAKVKTSPEARFSQVHKALQESHKSGYQHCIVIEESHCLPIPTLKHLKRFLELKTGFTRLVSVILIGQTELEVKLSERTASVREVVQRCEIVKLQPMDRDLLKAFLTHRLSRVNVKAESIFDDSAIDAISERLISKDDISQLYPLAVGNFVIAALNIAARLGINKISADIIAEVAK